MSKSFVNELNFATYTIRVSDCVVLKFGNSFEEVTGYTKDDVENGIVSQIILIPPEDLEEYMAMVVPVMTDGGNGYYEHRLKRKDGKLIFVFCCGSAYMSQEYNCLCADILITDVTETFFIKKEAAEVKKALLEAKDEITQTAIMLDEIMNNIVGGIGTLSFNKEKKTAGWQYTNLHLCNLFFDNNLDITDNFIELLHCNDRNKFFKDLCSCLNDHSSHSHGEYRLASNNVVKWLQIDCTYLKQDDDDMPLINAVVMDITERKNAQIELELQTERFNLITEITNEMFAEYDTATDTLKVTNISKGNVGNEVVINDFVGAIIARKKIHEEDMEKFCKWVFKISRTPTRSSVEFRTNLFSGDNYRWYKIVAVSISQDDIHVDKIIGRLSDIHAEKIFEEQLKIKSERDALTGLYNKGSVESLIAEHIVSENVSNSGKLSALLIIDIDNFKSVNDNLGHAYGDNVLSEVADKIKSVFRHTDIVGRIGGDEFIVLMKDIKKQDNAERVGNKLCGLIAKTYFEDDKEVAISSSIGIAVYPSHSTNYHELFNCADIALYKAKQNGKNQIHIYNNEKSIDYHSNRQ